MIVRKLPARSIFCKARNLGGIRARFLAAIAINKDGALGRFVRLGSGVNRAKRKGAVPFVVALLNGEAVEAEGDVGL